MLTELQASPRENIYIYIFYFIFYFFSKKRKGKSLHFKHKRKIPPPKKKIEFFFNFYKLSLRTPPPAKYQILFMFVVDRNKAWTLRHRKLQPNLWHCRLYMGLLPINKMMIGTGQYQVHKLLLSMFSQSPPILSLSLSFYTHSYKFVQ
jgi:hypothetical protein